MTDLIDPRGRAVTDIVERLRDTEAIELMPDEPLHAMCAEAAAEIERLRTTLASWEAAAAMARGSLAGNEPGDAPAVITGAAPNAPR